MIKYILSVIGGVLVSVAVVLACMTIADLTYTNSRVEAKTPTETARTAHGWDSVKVIEIKNEEKAEPEVNYFDCPLSESVQDCIFAECERYGISPAVVIAMIERESSFGTFEIGDDGRSFGLMQVQPKNHLQRMIDLGCTDLFNPIENVKVGINYLAEMQNKYGDITKALVAYNSGSYKGTITTYATEVMARANEVEYELFSY